jgi:acetylglutamate kinase
VTDDRELVVVKLGGTTLAEEHDTLAGVVEAATRYALVLVHGGGKRLTDWLTKLDVETRFEGGLRVTDDAALEVALAVLGGLVNGELVAELQRLGAPAVGLTGADGGLLVAERMPRLGRVGRVVGARPTALYALLAADQLPVVAPLALDETGEIVNVNADEAAAGLAGALGGRLILLTDTDGVHDRGGRTIAQLDELSAEQLISEGVISGGMIPKVTAALAVLRSGGSEVVIADGRETDALQRALDDPTFGTHLRLA